MFSFMKKKEEVKELKAIISGNTVPLEDVPDEIFSNKVLGDGVAFEPENDDVVCSPGDGVITVASDDMRHACGIQLNNGIELLIHIGINTVSMNGEGFTMLVKEGQKVKVGTPLIRFEADKIKAAGFPVTTMMIVTDQGDARNFVYMNNFKAIKGETVVATFE